MPQPWENPDRVKPLMRQRWEQLTFLHWPVDPEVVQRRLPAGLTADTHGGTAWVGLVPFRMEGIGLPRGPAVPYLGSFYETNVRTYVRGPAGPGVWFDSLDIDRAMPVAVARLAYGLPYMWAKMAMRVDGDRITYECARRRPHGLRPTSRVTIRVGDPIPNRELAPVDVFLTARWRLYAPLRGRLVVAPIDHPPWPLHAATVEALDDELVAAGGYPQPTGEPLVLFSPGVPVVAGWPTRLRKGAA